MLIAKPGDVYQIQPGLSSFSLSLLFAIPPSRWNRWIFKLCRGKSDKRKLERWRVSPLPWKIKDRLLAIRSFEWRSCKKFCVIRPIRSSNNQWVIEINTRFGLIYLDNPRIRFTLHVTSTYRLVGTCYRLKIRFIRPAKQYYRDNWLTFNGNIQLYFRLLTIIVPCIYMSAMALVCN